MKQWDKNRTEIEMRKKCLKVRLMVGWFYVEAVLYFLQYNQIIINERTCK